MPHFTQTPGPDGILTLLWDTPGRTMNIIDAACMDELEAIIARLAADAAIRGAVIASAKPAFSGGADLAMLAKLKSEAGGTADLRNPAARLGTLYRRLETCGKPVAAAINGICYGGAFELALACHFRIASPDARLGLPEAKLGLLPGAGGTQRLPRLIGMAEALKLMLRGGELAAEDALKLGALHAVAPPGELIAAATRWIAGGGQPVQPWDRPGFKLPGGAPYSAQGMAAWAAANALYRKETYDTLDAQRGIMSAVYEGLTARSIDAGLRIEIAQFTKLLTGRQAEVMMRSLFHSLQALNKGARRPKAEPRREVKTIGIAGAGFMGAGIAGVSARAGLDVVLLDRDQESAERGKAALGRLRMDDAAKSRLLARIHPSADYSALAPCDLVIEAVFEDKALKAEVWGRIDTVLPPAALRASNTSTLPITGLAQHVRDPGNFIGIHFFSPVDRMQLVEIIRGARTSDAALARALDFVRQIGKTPIVVNDSLGFFTSRVVFTYLAEGCALLAEGVTPALIENAGRMAGMPVGPLALSDEIALDLAWKIRQSAREELGPAFRAEPVDRMLETMVVQHQRFGRKNSKGFYDYPASGRKQLWPDLARIAPPHTGAEGDARAIGERLLLVQALETARCFAENVLTDVREADVGAILGFGFPRFTGGPLSWIDGIGLAAFTHKCRALAARHGPRFNPPPLCEEMARNTETFYGRFAPAA